MKNLLSAKLNLANNLKERDKSDRPAGALGALARGLAVSALLLGLGSLGLAAAYCYSQMGSAACHLLQLLVLAVSSLAGGFTAGRRAGSRGLHHGLALGLLLLACLCAVSLQTGGVAPLALLTKGLLLLLCGGLGGILGVA